MSNDYYEAAFKGDRKAAEDATKDIRRKIKQLRNGDHKLQFGCCVLRSLCQAITGNGVHYSIYCDILENTLAPNIDPKCNKEKWSRYLEFVRYYYSLLSNKKLCDEMQRVTNWMTNILSQLQSEKDYECVLQIFIWHLLKLTDFIDNENFEAVTAICETAKTITLLFNEMLKKNHELNYVYKDLLSIITPLLLQPKKYGPLYAKLSKDMRTMFDSMIVLLTTQRMPSTTINDSEALFIPYVEVTVAFVHMDIVLQSTDQVFVLKFLKASLDFKPFKSNDAIAYVLLLLYYLAKLVFAQNETPSFSQNYIALCAKLNNFFIKSGGTLIKEEWFMNVIVTMILMLIQLDDSNLMLFKVLRKQMENSMALCISHIELCYSLLRLAPSISHTKIFSWECCSSQRKHIALKLVQSSLKFYSVYMVDLPKKKTSDIDNKSEIILTSIVQMGINVINSMACVDSTSTDMQCFVQRFGFLLSKVTTDSQANMCFSLARNLVTIKTKISSKSWIHILRRLCAVAATTNDSNLIAEFHAIYIGYLIKEKTIAQSDLQNHITVFYTIKNLGWDKCLFEILQMSKSPLKPVLELEDERLLKTLETKIILKHERTNNAIIHSLLKGIEANSLEYVLIARQSHHMETIEKLRQNYTKLKRNQKLNCMNHLILAHTAVIFVNENVENLKKDFSLNIKDCSENDLDEILLNKDINNIDISVETDLISIISEAVQSFAAFYQEDLRSKLTASEEKQIDWVAVLDDVSSLARFSQFRGYYENAADAWHLLYTIANTLDDHYNILRAFGFLCEHAAFFEQTRGINLHCQVKKAELIIFDSIKDILTLVPRRQNYLLLSLCQLAFYYARMGNNAYANTLLMLAKAKRDEIPCRKGKFDVVSATIDAVKLRLLWIDKNESVRLDFRCIVRDIEVNLKQYRNIAYISSEDCLNYMTLLVEFLPEIAVCSINRLCVSSCIGWFICILKTAVESASALRVIQLFTLWAYANLQMEYVDKAQIKLFIAERFLKTKNFQQLKQNKIVSECSAEKKSDFSDLLTLQMDSGMEAMRRMAQVNLPAIEKSTLHDITFDLNIDLNRFRSDKTVIARNIALEWAYILNGCIYLRLFFLLEKHECLEEFYDYILGWCKNQEYSCVFKTSQKFNLMIFLHYANFLRAQKKYDKALTSILSALDFYNEFEMNADMVYKINLELQKHATKYDMNVSIPKAAVSSGKLRRALKFKLSPEDIRDQYRRERKVLPTNEDNALIGCLNTAFVDLCSSDENGENDDNLSTILATSKTEKKRIVKKPTIIKKNQTSINRKPLISLEISAELEKLHINTSSSEENVEKEVKTATVVAKKKSVRRTNKSIAQYANDRVHAPVRSTRNTRQQNKMLN